MVEENGEAPPARKSLTAQAKDSDWAHLLRFASTVILLPILAWLANDKLESIDRRISLHDQEFEKLENQVGQVVANQSAGQAQRDAQQKQLDGFQTWLQRLADRINNLKH